MSDPYKKAAEMRSMGASWREMERAVGLSVTHIRRRIDPGFRKRISEGQKLWRLRQKETERVPYIHTAAHTIKPEEARRVLATIPRDTRDFTARVCGDPLPGRSALDRRH